MSGSYPPPPAYDEVKGLKTSKSADTTWYANIFEQREDLLA